MPLENKPIHIHPRDFPRIHGQSIRHYSSIQGKAVQTQTTTRMNLENTMLSKRRKSKSSHIAWFRLYKISGEAKHIVQDRK